MVNKHLSGAAAGGEDATATATDAAASDEQEAAAAAAAALWDPRRPSAAENIETLKFVFFLPPAGCRLSSSSPLQLIEERVGGIKVLSELGGRHPKRPLLRGRTSQVWKKGRKAGWYVETFESQVRPGVRVLSCDIVYCASCVKAFPRLHIASTVHGRRLVRRHFLQGLASRPPTDRF